MRRWQRRNNRQPASSGEQRRTSSGEQRRTSSGEQRRTSSGEQRRTSSGEQRRTSSGEQRRTSSGEQRRTSSGEQRRTSSGEQRRTSSAHKGTTSGGHSSSSSSSSRRSTGSCRIPKIKASKPLSSSQAQQPAAWGFPKADFTKTSGSIADTEYADADLLVWLTPAALWARRLDLSPALFGACVVLTCSQWPTRLGRTNRFLTVLASCMTFPHCALVAWFTLLTQTTFLAFKAPIRKGGGREGKGEIGVPVDSSG